jgi:hypothetical protein
VFSHRISTILLRSLFLKIIGSLYSGSSCSYQFRTVGIKEIHSGYRIESAVAEKSHEDHAEHDHEHHEHEHEHENEHDHDHHHHHDHDHGKP